MKVGANFRYIVGQLYGDRRSSDIVRRRDAFIEHRYNRGKRHKALRESLRLMARIKSLPPNSRIRRKNRRNFTTTPPRRRRNASECHYFAQSLIRGGNIERFLPEF